MEGVLKVEAVDLNTQKKIREVTHPAVEMVYSVVTWPMVSVAYSIEGLEFKTQDSKVNKVVIKPHLHKNQDNGVNSLKIVLEFPTVHLSTMKRISPSSDKQTTHQ